MYERLNIISMGEKLNPSRGGSTKKSSGPAARRKRRPARPVARTQAAKKLNKKQLIGLILGAIVFFIPLLVDIPNLSTSGERMLSIFLLAIVFWITEPISLTATAVLVILLEVLMVSQGALTDPTGGDPALAETLLPASSYFAALANPVIILFLGGFMIADGAEKYGMDRNLAAVMLKPFSDSARQTTLGLMLITGILSMFMSNTASTATMFAVVAPLLRLLKSPKARTGLALSIPVAANVGGIGTPVGSPPNAITVAALAENGIQISFVDWMIMAIPFMLILLIGSWLFLCYFFIPKEETIHVEMDSNWNTSRNAKIFYFIAGLTIVLWMTEPLHGISSNTVGFFPVVALLALNVMDGNDVKKLDWPVLWLVSGGIALGTGVGATGLSEWLVSSIPWNSFSPLLILVVIGSIGFGIANLISHSAAANLLVPVAVALAVSLDGINTITVAVVVGIACSLGMSMPISTPPNAIAYATGEIKVSEMAFAGLVIGIVGTALLIFVVPFYWELIGMV